MLETREVHQEEQVYDMAILGAPDDDEDDALSFCDLPIYNGGDDASSRSNNQSSSYSFSSTTNENDDDDVCFDFSFSSSSSQSLEEKNIIIFCGKIIRPNRPPLPNINSTYYYSKEELQLLKGNNKSTRSSSMPRSTTEKKTCHARKNNKKTSSNSKWYLLMLGLVRIHQGGNMELNDIKKRQQTKRNHRRRSSNSITSGNREYLGGDLKIVNNEIKSGNNNKAAGLLSLLRSFSCTRTPIEDVDVDYCNKVKASLWYLHQFRAAPH